MLVRIRWSAKGAAVRHQTGAKPARSSGSAPSAQPVCGVVRDSVPSATVLRGLFHSTQSQTVLPGAHFPPHGPLREINLEAIALIAAALLTPTALVAFTMGLWIITSDLKWTREFFVPQGLLSHWQIWICTAAVLLLVARLLDRFGAVDEKSTS